MQMRLAVRLLSPAYALASVSVFVLLLIFSPLSGAAECLLDQADSLPADDKASTTPMRAATISGKNFDWQKRSRLPASANCQTGTGCDGIYIEPKHNGLEAELDPGEAPLRFASDKVHFFGQNSITFEGNVEIYQGSRRMRSDQVEVDRTADVVTLSGNVQVREPGLLMRAEHAEFDNAHSTASFDDAQYLVHEARIRGGAKNIKRQQDQTVILKGGTYTSCEPDNNDWEVKAAKIKLEPLKGTGSASHARIHVNDIPVFYFPYIEFPLGDQRKTGVLWPSISSGGSGGIDIAVPVYINLAPDYDLTLTPRYISDHGWLTETQFRYLNQYSFWDIGGAYIADDKEISGEKTEDNPDVDSERWAASVVEEGKFNRFWSSWIDYKSVSDASYLRDLGTTGLDIKRDVQLKQEGGLSYDSSSWAFTSRVTDYQTLVDDPDIDEPYKTVPRLDLNYRSNQASFEFDPLLISQYTYFEHKLQPRGQRLYIEPGITYPMNWLAGFVIPTAKVKHSSINLNSSNADTGDANAGDVSAVDSDLVISGEHSFTVPTFALDSGLFFERELDIYNKGYLQTLEPRLFYYHAKYAEGQNTQLFDTNELVFNYNQLYRGERFGSYDRIGDANQLTAGLSSRFYTNAEGREAFSIGLGQIFYFRDRRVTLDGETLTEEDASDDEIYKKHFRGASDIAAKLQWQPDQHWLITSDYIWDPYKDKTINAGLNFQFISSQYSLFNVGYRYARKDPIVFEGELVDTNTDQIDFSTVFPLNRQWSFIARWNYDLTDRSVIEEIAGLEYNNCCWKTRLIFQHERESFDNDQPKAETDPVEYENVVYFQLELKGLGGVADNVSRLLEESIQGFKQRNENIQ